jgi:hypothetical protein
MNNTQTLSCDKQLTTKNLKFHKHHQLRERSSKCKKTHQ